MLYLVLFDYVYSIEELYLEIYDKINTFENLKESISHEFIEEEYSIIFNKYEKLKNINLDTNTDLDMGLDEEYSDDEPRRM